MKTFGKVLYLVAFFVSSATLCLGQGAKEVRKTVPLQSDGTVTIETFKGSVTITAWDNPQVEVYARVEPDGVSATEAEKVQNTEVRIEPSGSNLSIKSDYSKLEHQRSGFIGAFNEEGNYPFVNYTISMPRTCRLDIKDHKSKTTVSGLSAAVSINTFKGSVVVSGLEGPIDLQTHKGDAKVAFAGLVRESHFDTNKGQIEVVIPRSGGFNLQSDLGRRGALDSNIDLSSLSQGKPARGYMQAENYAGAVNGGGPLVRVSTEKGHIRLSQS
jgi:hypothetical protein